MKQAVKRLLDIRIAIVEEELDIELTLLSGQSQ